MMIDCSNCIYQRNCLIYQKKNGNNWNCKKLEDINKLNKE